LIWLGEKHRLDNLIGKSHEMQKVFTVSNRDLYRPVQQGYFRDGLYYRLKVFPIVLQPLKIRKDDIP
jgi:transcriptional regulator with GAF, ATPase, and Fis domain